MRHVAIWVLVVASLLVAGCGTDGGERAPDSTGSAADTGAVTSSPAEASTDAEPPFPTATATQFVLPPQGAGGLVLTDVRAATQDGFDRIVLQFSGTGTPGWSVGYVDEPVLDGSGDVPRLDGDIFLDIYASNTTWPAEDYYSGPTQFEPDQGGDVVGVYVAGTFEGTTQVLAGLWGAAAPFRVFTLTDPVRLVVDVAHDAA